MEYGDEIYYDNRKIRSYENYEIRNILNEFYHLQQIKGVPSSIGKGWINVFEYVLMKRRKEKVEKIVKNIWKKN